MNVNVPEKLACLPFSGNSRSDLTAGGSKQVDGDTVFFFKVQSKSVTHRCGHVGNYRYLAFFLRSNKSAFPVGPDTSRVGAKKRYCHENLNHQNRSVHHSTP